MSDHSNSSASQPAAPPDLKAHVNFTGTQFVITNNDTFTWTDCKLEVNPKTFSSGFTYHAGSLAAGSVYTVGVLQFANDDGQRFNPLQYKPTSFSIACNTPGGRAFYFGNWG
ncbi:MAG TPA: hypothetical protein VGS57_01760 [Thermoanaerobaculia bacterium]|nr:hypothetical protein [Thermoanaerobaculia bacterium]